MDLTKAVCSTAKMLEMRDTLKRVMGDGYGETLAGWKRAVRQVMDREQCGAITALIRLGEAARDSGDGVPLLWLVAAAVEITAEDADA